MLISKGQGQLDLVMPAETFQVTLLHGQAAQQLIEACEG
jgi:hypothetical protein